jgi:NNP family nitrate/nitrite transporter-like MFS transporter
VATQKKHLPALVASAGAFACAPRNRPLWISTAALLLACAMWMVWSVLVVLLPGIGFSYSANQLFWLTALPGLSGATLRLLYSFMLPIFGGRQWTALSTASLLVPALGIGFAVQDPHTGYPTMLVLALLCGLGGGNFASSMANVSLFYPRAGRRRALGLNAALGALGVPLAQLLVPLAIGAAVFGAAGGDPQSWTGAGPARLLWVQNAGFIWVPFILLSTLFGWFGMNQPALAAAPFAEQAVIVKRKHNWIMCWLCTGAFGSLIGYAASLPLLTRIAFPGADPLVWAFVGPLAGLLAWSGGSGLADRLGAARVTLCAFVLMIVAALGVLCFLPHASSSGNFSGFFGMFMLLFGAAGIGHAATLRLIVRIFPAASERAAVLGFTSAVAAYGAFFIPKSFGTAIALDGSPAPALWCFIGFYASCIVMTWYYYLRNEPARARQDA